jgi:uroporphyrinogen decarboxylase
MTQMSPTADALTSRERVLRTIRRQETDRVPRDFNAEPAIVEGLCRRFGLDGLEGLDERFGVDMARVRVEYACPYADGRNIWGFRYEQVGPTRNVTSHPLAGVTSVDEVDVYAWPDPAWADVEQFKQRALASRQSGHAVVGSSWGSIFGESYRLIGMDNFMLAPVEHSEVAAAVVNHVDNFFLAVDKRVFEVCEGLLDLSYHGNDFGSQRGPLVSRAMFLEFFAQPLRELVEQAKSFGLIAMFHSCGAVSEIIPDLISCGVDILNPVQVTAAGMNLRDLKERFGARICFHGGISAQRVLPLGKPEEVRQHVRETLDIMKPDGGYIFASNQAVAEDTPPENVIAMYEAADTFGAYRGRKKNRNSAPPLNPCFGLSA